MSNRSLRSSSRVDRGVRVDVSGKLPKTDEKEQSMNRFGTDGLWWCGHGFLVGKFCPDGEWVEFL